MVDKDTLLRQLQDLNGVMRVTLAWKRGKMTAGVAMEQIRLILEEEL